MSYLREISIKAKWDGSFTEEWPKLRSRLCHEGALQLLAGQSDLEKLKTWAEEHGLLMDFEVDLSGFSSEVRSVTFSNDGQATIQEDSGAENALEGQNSEPVSTPVNATAGQGSAPREYFNWDAVDCR